MKIAIDVSQIVYETGVAWYTRSLVENLLKIDRKNQYILFGGSLRRLKDLRFKTHDLRGNYSTRFVPISPMMADFIWNNVHRLKIEKLVGRVDVFHSSDWSQPPSLAFKVTTVHDVAPLLFPALTHPRIVEVHRARLGWVKKEVHRVIVPSRATKKDLVEYGVDEEKIRVIPEAPRRIFKRLSDEEIGMIKKKYQIDGEYLLCIGIGERKNTARIVKAYKQVKKDSDLKLVLVGASREPWGDIEGVVMTGHVEDSELPAFYSGARALVYPSIHEGFGLPILEAFACGCPVVTSGISAMKEVAGDAGILVDPYKIESIAAGIGKVMANSASLIKKGKARVAEYSWERTARETLRVYEEGGNN